MSIRTMPSPLAFMAGVGMVSSLLAPGSVVRAELIDFEMIPVSGVPTEGDPIGSQYQASIGVTFSLQGGPPPVIAQVGAPQTAFAPNDNPLPNQGVGQYFLTDDGVVSGNPLPLIIAYDSPTSAASGAILDIDNAGANPEIYFIEARDQNDMVLELITITAGDPGTGDQLATYWSFARPTADILSIRIVAFRANNADIGLAFDNFNSSEPAPCTGAYSFVDFESLPGGGAPTDGQSINTQYEISNRITFSLGGGGNPVIAERGAPQTAFAPPDQPLSSQAGQFFLTDDGLVQGNPAPLIVDYTVPVSAASGTIIDIDNAGAFPEIFTIEARDMFDVVIESMTITAGDPGTGDAVSTSWSFYRPTADIYSVRIDAFREGDRDVGLAFDNFRACSVIPACVGQDVFIDFESIPGIGTPTEGNPISNEFLLSQGISFALADATSPLISQVGFPQTAFAPNDTPLPSQGVGTFFLTDDGLVIGNPEPLLISYNMPTATATGVVIDIDNAGAIPEIYYIEALDLVGDVLESITITAGDAVTGDQLAPPWSFYRPTPDIYAVRITAFRAGDNDVGLAFDNLTACLVGTPVNDVPSLPSHLFVVLCVVFLGVGLREMRMQRGTAPS